MPEPLLIAESDRPLELLPAMANRHGLVAGTYEQTVDRESAYELLKGRAEAAPQPAGDSKTESSKSWYEGLATTIGNVATGGSGVQGGAIRWSRP